MTATTPRPTDGRIDPTNPAVHVTDDCPDCGDDLPCFDCYETACPNGRFDCDGPRSEQPCPACRRAWFASGGRY